MKRSLEVPEDGIRKLQWNDREEWCCACDIRCTTSSKRHHHAPLQLCQLGVLTEMMVEDMVDHTESKDGNQVLHSSS